MLDLPPLTHPLWGQLEEAMADTPDPITTTQQRIAEQEQRIVDATEDVDLLRAEENNHYALARKAAKKRMAREADIADAQAELRRLRRLTPQEQAVLAAAQEGLAGA